MPHEFFTPNVLWKVHCAYRPRDNGNRAKPHFIMEVISDAYARAKDQSLTIHKLRAIVNLMLPRVVRGRYCTADIHPVSLSLGRMASGYANIWLAFAHFIHWF